VIISAIWDFEKSNKNFKLKIVPIVSIVFKPHASEKRKQVTVYNIFRLIALKAHGEILA
jgi:hypothetical protein